MANVNSEAQITILPAFAEAMWTGAEDVYMLSASDEVRKPYRFEKYTNDEPSNLFGYHVSSNTSEESLRALVQREKDRNDVVFFFLASLDRSLDLDIREESASLVEMLLANDSIYEYAEEVLASEPFRSTREASLELSFPALSKYATLISRAISLQEAAGLFWKAWSMLAKDTDSLSLSFHLDSLRDFILTSGVASQFIRSIDAADLRSFNSEIVNLTLHSEVREQFGAAPQLLTKLRNLLDRHNAFDRLQMSFEAAGTEESDSLEERSSFGRYGKPLLDHEIYSQIIKQISSIKPLLYTGSQQLVDRAVRELLDFQRLHCEPEYLAMTLCNLTKLAIDANEIHIAKQLSDEATSLEVNDPIVDSTAAEVMKALGNFSKAKSIYESALVKYGEQRYLVNAFADVLKESGQFDEALSIYERAELAFPNDPVAPNGISTVYFAMGHPERALAKAQSNVKMFGDLVSRVIFGNFLRHLGRNHESLALMEETIKQFPREMSAWNGYIRSLNLVGRQKEAITECERLVTSSPDVLMPRLLHGELLRKSGRLIESLSSFNKSLIQFPSHRGLRAGKAAVLLLLGRTSEAAELTEISTPQSELDWRMFHIFASCFIRLGKYEEALSSLEWGLASVPWLKLHSLFSDTIGYVKLRMGNVPAAIDDLRKGLRTADRPKRNGIYLLLGRAYSDIGNLANSSRYLAAVTSNDLPVIELKAATKPGIHLIRDSGPTSAKIEQNEFQMLLAAA